MTPQKIAREIFPDKDDEFLEHAIWSKTGFPAFWRLENGESIEDCLRRQLTEYKEALKLGVQLCDFCNIPALPEKFLCLKCEDALKRCRESDD